MTEPFGIQVRLDREFQMLGAYQKLGEGGATKLFQRTMASAGEILRTTLVETYENGVPGLAALHPFTVDMKGHSQPLSDTGRLAKAVEFIVIRRGSRIDYMVGFSAEDDVIQASVLELGATLTVTPKMRRFLAANGLALRKSTEFLRIPARPVFLHALEKAQPEMLKILQSEFNKELSRNRLQAGGLGSFWGKLVNRLRNAFR